MVDYKTAFSLERKVIDLLAEHEKLKKYKFILHPVSKFDVDIIATAPGYEEFAIEVEGTEKDKWPSDAPYPVAWKKGFSVATRKKKFYCKYPMSLFIKLNPDFTRAALVPMSYIFSQDMEEYENDSSKHFTCNEFYLIVNADHSALCFTKVEDLADVVSAHFKHMVDLKRVNAKYTDMRPIFSKVKRKEI